MLYPMILALVLKYCSLLSIRTICGEGVAVRNIGKSEPQSGNSEIYVKYRISSINAKVKLLNAEILDLTEYNTNNNNNNNNNP